MTYNLRIGATVAAMAWAGPASAQDNTVSPAIVSPEILPSPTQGPEPTPIPTPTATVVPIATPTPIVKPSASPTSVPTPRPIVRQAPDPTPSSSGVVAPVRTSIATVAPKMPTTAAPTRKTGGVPGWVWLAGVVGLAAAVIVLTRRRRADKVAGKEGAVEAGAANVAPLEAPRPAVRVQPPEVTFRPVRIGLNLISATVEGEVAIRATEVVEDVRVWVILLGAAAGHEAAVATFHEGPAGRLVVPPFALEAGETRRLRAVAGLARQAIAPLEAGGRAMFVPLLAITIEWRDGAGEHRRTQAFAVGVERVDSAKLAPVWLDDGARNYDAVAARPHGPALG